MNRPGKPWRPPTPVLTLGSRLRGWLLRLLKEPAVGIFHRKREQTCHPSPQASLIEAKAARRQQEVKKEYADYVQAKLNQAKQENDIAVLLRRALGGRA